MLTVVYWIKKKNKDPTKHDEVDKHSFGIKATVSSLENMHFLREFNKKTEQ